MKMEQTECSEMLEYKIQTPGNYSEESVQHSEQGVSLKSRIIISYFQIIFRIHNITYHSRYYSLLLKSRKVKQSTTVLRVQ